MPMTWRPIGRPDDLRPCSVKRSFLRGLIHRSTSDAANVRFLGEKSLARDVRLKTQSDMPLPHELVPVDDRFLLRSIHLV